MMAHLPREDYLLGSTSKQSSIPLKNHASSKFVYIPFVNHPNFFVKVAGFDVDGGLYQLVKISTVDKKLYFLKSHIATMKVSQTPMIFKEEIKDEKQLKLFLDGFFSISLDSIQSKSAQEEQDKLLRFVIDDLAKTGNEQNFIESLGAYVNKKKDHVQAQRQAPPKSILKGCKSPASTNHKSVSFVTEETVTKNTSKKQAKPSFFQNPVFAGTILALSAAGLVAEIACIALKIMPPEVLIFVLIAATMLTMIASGIKLNRDLSNKPSLPF